jgi:hypothetical protein
MRSPRGAGFLVALLLASSCGGKKEATAPLAEAAPPPAEIAQEAPAAEAPPAAPLSTAEGITDARQRLENGRFDEAAARLAQMQLQGAAFNAQQAKDYRQALSEAYDRAIEAVQRGDPRGQAAIELLRAAAPK